MGNALGLGFGLGLGLPICNITCTCTTYGYARYVAQHYNDGLTYKHLQHYSYLQAMTSYTQHLFPICNKRYQCLSISAAVDDLHSNLKEELASHNLILTYTNVAKKSREGFPFNNIKVESEVVAQL